MSVTITIKSSGASDFKSCFCISLRIQFDQLHTIIGNCCQKRNIMLLCHGMIHGHIILIFHNLRSDAMGIVHRLRFHRRQRNTAAANHSLAGAVDHVSTDRTDIPQGTQHICTAIGILNFFSGKQLEHRYAQCDGKRFQ